MGTLFECYLWLLFAKSKRRKVYFTCYLVWVLSKIILGKGEEKKSILWVPCLSVICDYYLPKVRGEKFIWHVTSFECYLRSFSAKEEKREVFCKYLVSVSSKIFLGKRGRVSTFSSVISDYYLSKVRKQQLYFTWYLVWASSNIFIGKEGEKKSILWVPRLSFICDYHWPNVWVLSKIILSKGEEKKSILWVPCSGFI